MREPNFENLLAVLRCEEPARPTLFEFFLNLPLYKKLAAMDDVETDNAAENCRMLIRAFTAAGYDYVTVSGSKFGFPVDVRARAQTISMNDGTVIHDRASFQAYAWQSPDDHDYSLLETMAPELPEGMKFIVCGPGGVLENVIGLVGYEDLCLLMYDDPELVQDIFDAVGSRLVRHYEIAAGYPSVGACISNDDWGFKTQTMLGLSEMRKYVFPWHTRIVETIHAAGKPAILHSCGFAGDIMEEIIEVMRYDGKHSYEDIIQPVEEAYDTWGGRIAILGGIDLDFLIRSPREEVTRRSRAMLQRSRGKGGYALGTGNSVPAYVPDDHYFAMTKAALADDAVSCS